MARKTFTWTNELAERMLELRFSNDWLFQKSKQPWPQFYQLLLDNGFPKDMTVDHVRKKYGYMYDMYKIAKKSHKPLPYYEYFDKHYRKAKITDLKYESWSDEWRFKLITCVIEATVQKIHYDDLWRTVEKALRTLDLPIDCCIQDIQGLWHHINVNFNRKHRIMLKKGTEVDWPLYAPLLEFYQSQDPEYLQKIEADASIMSFRGRKSSDKYYRKAAQNDEGEFQWNKHITEAFIQIRLQHDSLFKERKWVWNDLCAIMIKEHGFPKTLTGREISRKWASTYAEYQKAKATNNISWIWYSLFEAYLGGVGSEHTLNPTAGWQEEWISNLISARTDLDYLFIDKDQRTNSWREVEKRLRAIGIPLDHSLLHLKDIWRYLLKTFYWKKKFAKKGLLSEQWPYLDAMSQYDTIKVKLQADHDPKRKRKRIKVARPIDNYFYDDEQNEDFEDDMKLFDLKQKLGLVKPKVEVLEANSCRSCYSDVGCVNIFDQRDSDGLSLADKLKVIGDIQVDPSDGKPSQICFNCLRDLENAYKFRRKCQEADKMYKNHDNTIKVEISAINDFQDNHIDLNDTDFETHIDNTHLDDDLQDVENKPQKSNKKKWRTKEKLKKYKRYRYFQMCDICGKVTQNLKHHLDAHAPEKFYECDQCGKKFKFKGTLIIHRAVHDATPKKTCEVCGKTFHIVAQYKRHFAHHANERKFECDTCGKRFNSTDILKVHMRIHTDERPFSCSECGKTFRTAGCVSRHKRIVHKPGKTQLI